MHILGVATSTQDVVGERDKTQLMTHEGTAWRECYIRLDVVKETDEDLFLIIGKVIVIRNDIYFGNARFVYLQ